MNKRKRERAFLLLGSLCLVLSLTTQYLARAVDGFGELYGCYVYPLWVGTIGRFFGLFSFSVSEIGLYLLVVWFLIFVSRSLKKPKTLVVGIYFMVSILVFLYTFFCGINYYRYPFSYYADLEMKARPVEELRELCQMMTDKLNDLSGDVAGLEGYDSDMPGTSSVYHNMKSSVRKEGVAALENIGDQYSQLGGYYPLPKPVLISSVLSVQQICGIYLPFTIEANYNRDIWGYNIPLTVCHELSHLKGFMREDEANFIGYLACIQSDRVEFQYSGYLLGWIYASQALAKVDWDGYVESYRQLPPMVLEDLKENSLFWDQYDTRVAEVSTKINDTYLKMNSQDDGILSYDRVVDLMLAYHDDARGKR